MSGRLTLGERIIEIIAVLLLGLATVGTAWCGYQAAQWNSENADLARSASDQHVEAARLYGAAIQRISYDSNVVAQYAQARVEGEEGLLRFYRASLIREGFLPVLERWESSVRTGQAPTRLTEDKEYLTNEFAEYNTMVAAAEQTSRDAQAASDYASGYVATTILLAVALFFAGVTASFQFRPARVLLLVGALATVAAAATRLAELPVV